MLTILYYLKFDLRYYLGVYINNFQSKCTQIRPQLRHVKTNKTKKSSVDEADTLKEFIMSC